MIGSVMLYADKKQCGTPGWLAAWLAGWKDWKGKEHASQAVLATAIFGSWTSLLGQ